MQKFRVVGSGIELCRNDVVSAQPNPVSTASRDQGVRFGLRDTLSVHVSLHHAVFGDL